MTRATVLFAVLLSAFAAREAAATQQPQANTESAATVLRLLEESGLRYAKQSDSAWTVTFEADNSPSVRVVVHAREKDVALYSIVAYKVDATNETEVMRQLLRKNAELPPGVTLYIDRDGDYIAAAFHDLKALSATAFTDSIRTFASGADSAYGAIKQYLAAGRQAKEPAVSPAGGFSVPATASRTIDLLSGKASISFDASRWTQKAETEKNRFEFEHKDGDGYALVIAERLEVPVDKLKDLALHNARAKAPDARIVAEERRRVNGTDVTMVRLEATITGVNFVYFDYLLSGPAGTIQVITYTGRNLFDEFKRDFEDFLNGVRMTTGR